MISNSAFLTWSHQSKGLAVIDFRSEGPFGDTTFAFGTSKSTLRPEEQSPTAPSFSPRDACFGDKFLAENALEFPDDDQIRRFMEGLTSLGTESTVIRRLFWVNNTGSSI